MVLYAISCDAVPCYDETPLYMINLSPPVQNGRRFVDNIFKGIFVNEKLCIFIPKGPINSNPALV